MALPDLAQACRKSGLRVVELSGWKHRGRPASTGGFAPRGVLVHHTGSSRDDRDFVDWMTLTGRSDLPAPLCQLALDRSGTVYVCAAGRANHGGTAKASGPMPGGDGNELYIGIEALNTGSEGWSAAQYDAYARLCAALCEHYGWPASHVRAHRETSVTGKWDPGLLDMDNFRRDIANLLEDDMPTPEDLLNTKVKVIGGEEIPLGRMLSQIHNRVGMSRDRLGRALSLLREAAKTDANVADALAEIQAALDEAGDGSPRA